MERPFAEELPKQSSLTPYEAKRVEGPLQKLRWDGKNFAVTGSSSMGLGASRGPQIADGYGEWERLDEDIGAYCLAGHSAAAEEAGH